MSDLTIRQRLYLLAGTSFIASCLVLGIMGLSYQSIGQDEQTVRQMEKTVELTQLALRGTNETLLTEGSGASLKLTSDSLENLKHTLQKTREAIGGGQVAEAFESTVVPAANGFFDTLGLFLQAKQFSATDDDSLIMLGKASTQGDKLINLLLPLIEATHAENKAHKHGVLQRAIVISILILMVPALLTYFISRAISNAIGSLRQSMQNARANWDLSVRTKMKGKDEIGACSRDFDALIEAFQHIVRQTNETTSQLFSSAQELTMASQKVADASDRQNRAATTTKDAVQVISGSLGQVLSLVSAAEVMSREESATASLGNATSQRAVTEMLHIAQSVQNLSTQISELSLRSGEISSIVQVIKEIADQTNLLALNAAIEAARAGEQGRGFAVVADEVRKLAERTTQATARISELIGGIRSETTLAVGAMEDSRAQVDHGAKLIKEVGDSLNDIDQESAMVSRHIVEIANATNEQKQSVNQISRHVEDIAQMAGNNSSASQTVLHAAQTVERLTGEVQELLSRFKS